MKSSLLFFFFVALMAKMVRANIVDFDEVWQKRAEEARRSAIEAYEKDPEVVTEHLNHHVRMVLEGTNSTRRGLKKNRGPCKAMNPIDRCWRCRKDWEKNRKKLASCVLGFGRKTSGGKKGNYYVVTDSSDDDIVNPKPGTLRHAVIQTEPLWIIFERDMVIRLCEELIVTSHKTIDGRGASVDIAHGAGITIQYVKNVIIHGIHMHDIHPGKGGIIRDSLDHVGQRSQSDGDAISVFGSTNVWIDHISLSNCADGLVDVIQGSTAVTVSNCHLAHHNEVMLFGGSDSFTQDKIMQITVAFNHFGKGLMQRMPRCRHGFFHVVNNDYTHWLMYAVGGSSCPTILSQGNRYTAPPNPHAKQVTKREVAESEWKKWTWRSEGDILLNGAFFLESGDRSTIRPYTKKDVITAKPASFVTRLCRYAGALDCYVDKPC